MKHLLVTKNCHHQEGFECFSRYEEIWELISENQLQRISMWRPVLLVSREHGLPHFCPPPWTSSGGCWRSAGVAAHDLILVEVSGKCCWQVPICGWHAHDIFMLQNFVLPSTLHSTSCLRAVSSFCNNFSYPFPPGWVLYVCRSVTLISKMVPFSHLKPPLDQLPFCF